MTNNKLTPETLISVTNRSNGSVVYRIPERHIRREFNRKETKKVPFQEIMEVAAQPGGRELIYNFLLIESEEVVKDGLNLNAEPEYWLTEDMIAGEWMDTCTLNAFKDALDFAPEGVKALIKKYAVSKPLNDMAKRQALLDQLKFDVTKAFAMNEAETAAKEPSGRRETITPAAGETGRRAATPTYTIVTPKSE